VRARGPEEEEDEEEEEDSRAEPLGGIGRVGRDLGWE